METTMSKTNDCSKLVTPNEQLDGHGALADSELVAVTGGKPEGSWLREIAFAMGQAANNYASKVGHEGGGLWHEAIHAS
jgi:hypothetical protein